MENKIETVKFDPGYAPFVLDSLGQVGYIYYTFSAVPNLKLKKLNFPLTLRKLEKALKKNIAFYLGCLLWATYIKQFDNAQIEGNQLLNDDCSEEEYTSEINFLIDFVKTQLPKDSKYYINKEYNADEKYLPILETYKQFLIINNGFVKISNVNQINLPDNLKKVNKKDLEVINEKIQKAIHDKEIEQLFDCWELIF